jgi:integrase
MASIEKREGRGNPWRVRYRTPDGKSRSRQFGRKVDAQRFLVEIEHRKNSGAYLDPSAGKVTFGAFVQQWLAAQTFDPATREAVETRLRVHILSTFGAMEIRAIRPSMVQSWLRGRHESCAASYVKVILANLSTILGAAVEDGLIARNPCRSSAVKAPTVERDKVVPWTRERVDVVIRAHPDRYGALPVVAAGCGLRQGEVFGLRVEDVDFLRRKLHVRQQVKLLHGKPIFALPKGGKTREVPLPDVVATAVAEHLRAFPAREITLPWESLDGEPTTALLVFTSRQGGALHRTHYNPYVWKKALRAAGVEPTRANGCTRCGTTTPACCSTLARASGRWRTTSGTPTPGSPCACTRT